LKALVVLVVFVRVCLRNSIFKKIGLPKILATIVNLPNIAGALNNLEKLATIANLDNNQDTTLFGTIEWGCFKSRWLCFVFHHIGIFEPSTNASDLLEPFAIIWATQ